MKKTGIVLPGFNSSKEKPDRCKQMNGANATRASSASFGPDYKSNSFF
jgi:hypothetical protein